MTMKCCPCGNLVWVYGISRCPNCGRQADWNGPHTQLFPPVRDPTKRGCVGYTNRQTKEFLSVEDFQRLQDSDAPLVSNPVPKDQISLPASKAEPFAATTA